MPTIALSDAYDAKLKMLVSEPFEDTRESLIEGLIDEELKRREVTSKANGRMTGLSVNALLLPADSREDLNHTRVVSAMVDGREMHRPKWNSVVTHLHVLGRKRLGSFDALRRASSANLRKGKYEAEGYKHLPDADLSIQGVSANLAWRHSLSLARALNVPIMIRFEWRDKEGAAHPGRTAILEWNPQS